MNVTTYLVAQNVHGPRSTTPNLNVNKFTVKKYNTIHVQNYGFQLLLVISIVTKAWGLTVYLLVNIILRITIHLQMLYRQFEDHNFAPPWKIISDPKSSLTKAFVLLAPFPWPEKHNITLLPWETSVELLHKIMWYQWATLTPCF